MFAHPESSPTQYFGRRVHFLSNFTLRFLFTVNSLTINPNTSLYRPDSFEVIRNGGYLHVAGLQFRWDYILIYTLLRFLQGGGFGKQKHELHVHSIVVQTISQN